MKKITFGLAVVFLFFSCEVDNTITIENQSTQTISYVFTYGLSATKKYTIEPGQIENFTGNSHQMGKYSSAPINDGVYYVLSGSEYVFFDIDPIPAAILNILSKEVILSANGAISNEPLTVNPGEEILEEYILSNKPLFTAETIDGYPVQVDYRLVEDTYKIVLR